MNHIDGYDDAHVLARSECGTVLSATDGTDYMLITDESTLADLLGSDDADLLDRLVHVRRFPTTAQRDRAAASLLSGDGRSGACRARITRAG